MGAVLLADIGGTNVRLAFAEAPGIIGPVSRYVVADWPSLEAVLEYHLREHDQPTVSTMRIAAAGPVDGDVVSLTNAPWTIHAHHVSSAIGGGVVDLFNDLEGLAYLLPHCGDAEASALFEGARSGNSRPRLAINIGTGFGAATVIPMRDGYKAIATEAGHMSLLPASPQEQALFGSAGSIEDVLSGDGMVRLFQALSDVSSQPEPAPDIATAADVFVRAKTCAIARKTIVIANSLLARVAGDLVLATGAWGGVYFCGSVAKSLLQSSDQEVFQHHFHCKGAMKPLLQRVPVFTITADEPTLLALSYYR